MEILTEQLSDGRYIVVRFGDKWETGTTLFLNNANVEHAYCYGLEETLRLMDKYKVDAPELRKRLDVLMVMKGMGYERE